MAPGTSPDDPDAALPRARPAPYRDRRDFVRATDPRTGAGAGLERGSHPIFVVQQHDARRMHWDFRLEVDGTLASWAVPKGPSLDPAHKRLAVRTDDHALEYADFEGEISKGAYGAGAVIVWDAGPYRNTSRGADGAEVPLAEALARGRAEVWLEGLKLRGAFALVHARLGGDEKNWLLIKKDDEGADSRARRRIDASK